MFFYLSALLLKNPGLVFRYLRAKQKINRLEEMGDVLFVFPCYHVGGAEKAHYRIAQEAHDAGLKCGFVFAERSVDNAYLQKFKNLGPIIDLAFRYDNKKINNRLTELLIKQLNASEFRYIFTSNSRYFYGLLGELKQMKVIDLVHAYNPPFEVKNLDFSGVFDRIAKRVFINAQAFCSMQHYYEMEDLKGVEKFKLIYNAPFTKQVEPGEPMKKEAVTPFHVLFVARNSPEKRPAIAFALTSRMLGRSKNFHFHMVGDFGAFKEKYATEGVFFYDHLKDAEEIIPLYQKAHALILTSETEGFPLVLSEAMFYNVVPVTTNVGGIGGVIQHGVNGMLIDSAEKEPAEIEEKMEEALLHISQNKELYSRLSRETFTTAKQIFGSEKFSTEYRQLFSK